MAQRTNKLCEDCIPVSKIRNHFHVILSHSTPSVKRKLPQTFDDYISEQPTWIQELIQHYKQNLKVDPLFTYIIQQTTFIISTDGAKGNRRSGGS